MIKTDLPKETIQAIVQGQHGSPYDILGLHRRTEGRSGIVIRAMQPFARKVEVLDKDSDKVYEMVQLDKGGLFEIILSEIQPYRQKPMRYLLRMTDDKGHQWTIEDTYGFPLQITDFDVYLIGEGSNYRMYEKMGAHPMTIDGIEGVHFAVWAPNAQRVSVVGAFNRWDGRHHPMQKRGDSGLWELFLTGLKPGDLYKFEVRGKNGYIVQKTDPYGFASELRPQTASIIWDVRKYEWQDTGWMDRRPKVNWLEEPISVYEVHLGSWRRNAEEGNRWLNYRELAHELIPYVKKLGFSHIEVLPITEHPFDGSWGYQTIGYYAPTSRFGSPDDFKYFVDQCHQNGLGVILDWVPAHFPKDGHGLAYFDGTHLYEHADWRLGEHKEWGTYVFNYGRSEVRDFLLSSAMFWADVYHIDGLRVDAVASMLYLDYSRKPGEWVPNKYGGKENLEAVDFLKKFNILIHAQYPGFLTYAEESTSWPMVSRPVYLGGLGFDLKWNMGWMHDVLEYMSKAPIHRKYHHNGLTFSLVYAFNENFILPFSHDEVVHGKCSMFNKMPGDAWQKFASLRLLYSFMYAHPGKKLLFMGDEFGQHHEWNYQESLQWPLLQEAAHSKLQHCVETLNNLYRQRADLHQIDFTWEGFQWIDYHDAEQSVISFLRKGKKPGEFIVCIFNFTPVPRNNYRLGVPVAGRYVEIFCSDAAEFGGSNVRPGENIKSEQVPWQNMGQSIVINLPPLAGVYLELAAERPEPVVVVPEIKEPEPKPAAPKPGPEKAKKTKATKSRPAEGKTGARQR